MRGQADGATAFFVAPHHFPNGISRHKSCHSSYGSVKNKTRLKNRRISRSESGGRYRLDADQLPHGQFYTGSYRQNNNRPYSRPNPQSG